MISNFCQFYPEKKGGLFNFVILSYTKLFLIIKDPREKLKKKNSTNIPMLSIHNQQYIMVIPYRNQKHATYTDVQCNHIDLSVYLFYFY